MVKMGSKVGKTCIQTDRQTDRPMVGISIPSLRLDMDKTALSSDDVMTNKNIGGVHLQDLTSVNSKIDNDISLRHEFFNTVVYATTLCSSCLQLIQFLRHVCVRTNS